MANGPTNQELGITTEQHGRDIISLRDYFETLFREYQSRTNERFEIQDKAVSTALSGQEKAVAAAIEAADRAVTKAEIATEKRFDSVNEFRQTLSDQTATLMPRAETEIRLKSLVDRLENIDKIVTTYQGQQLGESITMSKIYTAIGAVGAILAIIVLLANNVFKG